MSGSARLVTTAGVLAAFVLAGCGGGDDSEQVASDTEQTLTVWAMGEEGKRLQDVADEFNKEFPNITVKVTPVGWDQAHQKLVAAAGGGELPDMAQMGSTFMGEFIELGVLEPIDTGTFNESDFFPASWENNIVDGEVYGVPWYVDTRALYYRTDLAEKAGAKHPPANWAELKELAVAYKSKAGSEFGISLPPGGEGSWQNLLPFLYSAGGELVDADGNVAVDSPAVVKALTEYQSYFSEDLTSKSVQPGEALEQDFGSGAAPMFISGPWMVENISKAHPDLDGAWDVVPLPADQDSVSWVGGASLVTFTDSKHQAAAEEFTKFLTSPEKQADWFEIAKALPANVTAWDEPALADNAPLQVFKEQLTTAGAVPVLSRWNEFAHEIDNALEQLTQNNTDPAEIASQLQSTLEPLAE